MITAKLQPLSRELELAVRNDLAPAARSRLIAQTAREDILAIDAQNDAAVGTDVRYSTAVNGRVSAVLESVDPDRGTIAAMWQLGTDVVQTVGDMLRAHSPVLKGVYRASHILLADGQEVSQVDPKLKVQEWVYISGVPYARKIEKWSIDGVYEAVAALARARFGNIAKITFAFRSLARGGGTALDRWASSESGRAWARARAGRRESLHADWLRRQPAIVITML